MDRLPAELLHRICAYLEKDADIKTFRQLARRYAEIGLEYLSPVLHIACLSKSWEKLEGVSNDPVMRHHVRELLFEPSLLQAYGTFDLYTKGVKRAPGSHEFKQDQLQEGWNLYKKAFEEQELLYDRLRSPGVFKAALARFPNLSVIRLQAGNSSCASSSFVYNDISGMKLGKYFWKYLVRPRALTSIDVADRMTCSVLQDVAALNMRLDELYIGFTHWRLLQVTDTVWESILKASRHLTKFKLHMVFHHQERDARDDDAMWDQVNDFNAWMEEQEGNQNDRLNMLLEFMPKLEILDLNFDVHHRGWDGSVQLGWLCSCLKTHPPANLRELSLHHIKTDKSSIQQMLQSCASSLRSLAMSHIHLLHDNGWVDIISELPRVLKLDHIWLGRNLGEGSDPEAHPFSFNDDISPRNARSREIAQAILSLILKTDDAMLEITCSEIRRLLPELHEALSIEYEQMENYHQQLFHQELWEGEEELWISTPEEDGEEEWISTSEEGEEEQWISTSEEDEEESNDSDNDNSINRTSNEY